MNQRQLASVLFAVIGLFIVIFRLPELFAQGALIAGWDRMVADPAGGVDQRSFLVASTAGHLVAVVLECPWWPSVSAWPGRSSL